MTKGIKNSIIFDFNTGFLQLIPKTLFDLLADEKQNYSLLRKQLDNDGLKTLEDYLDFIIDNNLGCMISSKKELINFQVESDFKETHSGIDYFILDINNSKILNDSLIQQIYDLKIKYLQIRCLENLTSDEIADVISKMKVFNHSDINEISIIAKYCSQLISFIKKNHYSISDKFLNFIMHSSEIEDFQVFGYTYLTMIKNKIKIPLSCGVVTLKNLTLNRSFYLESQCHSSCLYKKISIDTNGNIKNCPSMPQSFGNIADVTLEQAIDHVDFRKYWNLTKDRIEVCKDCEFRYICTDCRAYTEKSHQNNEGLDVSKPLKCGYDPYSGEWEDWSTNPLKQKAKQYYKMN